MKTWMYAALFVSGFALSTGCHSVEKMMDQGRYDDLLNYAEKKITGKKDNKLKYVLAIEDGFRKVTEKDMARIERLKSSNRSEDWQEIMRIAERIQRRQDKLSPFLPLVADNGYQATFSFVKVSEIADYAEMQLIDALYEEGLSFLRQGRGGDKHAARQAYDKFAEIIDRTGDIRDAVANRDEARSLGVIRVVTEIDNHGERFMPVYVADAIEQSVRHVQGDFWTQYYDAYPADERVDLIARVVIRSVDVGPDAISREEIKRSKKIEDGWEYVLDERGNVAKDSLGNDIKRTRYAQVNAVVLRTLQEKVAILRGDVVILDAANQQTLETRPIALEHRFTHQAQSFVGDERALEKSDRVVTALAPFPADETMMMAVAERLRDAFDNELQKSRYL